MDRMRKLLVGVALAASTFAAGAAQATILFSDNFNSENGGLTQLNYTGFANWTVTGQVDLVKSPDYSITCPGSCVDLDGSSGPGSILSSSILYNANEKLTISFDMSGNQRGGTDQFDFTAYFGASQDITNFGVLTGFTYGGSGSYFGLASLGLYTESVPTSKAFTTYSLEFIPTTSGSMKLYFATPSGDNVGPLIDNVLVTSTGVPEPATWAMMITGFGMAGIALRRRRAALAA